MLRREKMMRCSVIILILTMMITLIHWPSFIPTTIAAQSYKIKILEINDLKPNSNGQPKSELSSLGSAYEITTMRMKQFVAMRDELAGKYDVIYIGSSDQTKKYNAEDITQGVNGGNAGSGNNKYSSGPDNGREMLLASSGKKNDITDLRAKELQKAYVNQGLLVLLHEDAFTNDSTKLKLYASSWLNTNNANVKKVKSADILSTINSYLVHRPHLLVTASPKEYSGSNDHVYKAGETISFAYMIENYDSFKTKPLVAKLYIDADFNLRFEEHELELTSEVNSSTGTITYSLPREHSGIRFWKLELVDLDSGRSDYQIGTFRFLDETVKVNVLQVYTDVNSSLNDARNMGRVSLTSGKNELDYNITVTTQRLTEFNTSGYKKLNGAYDMLIFGFADVYNNDDSNSKISNEAAAAIKEFIKTGQSVMFTHDTIYKATPSQPDANNSWVNQFKEITGQKGKYTNVGFGGPFTSTTTRIVNDGLITMFPYKINALPQITVNTTHDQYYELDLEDPEIFPWYNMIYANIDRDDSWNNYYTYSKGTITYSGTGHTNTNFPLQEQQLFVNTMYQAYVGANHAPVITVFAPNDDETLPMHNELFVSYSVQDFDFVKQDLFTRVSFSTDGTNFTTAKEVAPQTFQVVDRPTGSNGANEKWMKVENGTHLNIHLEIPYPKEGKLYVKFDVQDEHGAESSEIREINLKETISKMNVARTPLEKALNKDETLEITYTITPSPIDIDQTQKNGVEKVRPIGLKEDKLLKWAKVGSSNIDTPIVIGDTITVFRNEVYPLLLSENVNETQTTYQENIKNGYSSLYTSDKKPIYKDSTSFRNDVFDFEKNKIQKGNILIVPIVAKDLSTNNPATITRFASFTVTDFKQAGNSDNSNLQLKFNGFIVQKQPDQMKVTNIQFTENFPARLNVQKPNNMQLSNTEATGYKLTGSLPDINYRLDGSKYIADPVVFSVKVTPKQYGIFTLNDAAITYDDIDGTAIPAQAFNPVRLDVIGIRLDAANQLIVDKGKTLNLIPTLDPADAPKQEFEWRSNDETIAKVDQNGVVTGVAQGKVQMNVWIKNNPKVKASVTVTVRDLTLNANKTTAPIDEPIGMTVVFNPTGVTAKPVNWAVTSNGGQATITPESDGPLKATLKGTKEGKVTVTATTTDGNLSASMTLEITSNLAVEIIGNNQVEIGNELDLKTEIKPNVPMGTTYKWEIVSGMGEVQVVAGKTTQKDLKIIGTKPGKVTIKVTVTANGKSVSTMKVIDVTLPTLTGLRFNPSSKTIYLGDPKYSLTTHLEIKTATTDWYKPNEHLLALIDWSVNRTDLLSLDTSTIGKKGDIQGVKIGKAIVKAELPDSTGKKFNATIEITIARKGSNDY